MFIHRNLTEFSLSSSYVCIVKQTISKFFEHTMNTIKNHINPFEINSGSMRITNLNTVITVIGLLSVLGLIIIKAEVLRFALCMALFFVTALVYTVFKTPKVGIYLLIILGFFVTGAARYVVAPWGLTIDAVLVLIYVALFFKGFAVKLPWIKAKSSLTLVVSIWMAYVFLELGNPEVLSREAWFYAMRGVALYQFLAIPLLFMLFNKQKVKEMYSVIICKGRLL